MNHQAQFPQRQVATGFDNQRVSIAIWVAMTKLKHLNKQPERIISQPVVQIHSNHVIVQNHASVRHFIEQSVGMMNIAAQSIRHGQNGAQGANEEARSNNAGMNLLGVCKGLSGCAVLQQRLALVWGYVEPVLHFE